MSWIPDSPPPKLILCPQDTTAGLPSESKYFWAGLFLASVTVIFKEPFFCLKCFCCFYEQARFPPTPHISLKFRGTSSGGAGGHYPLEMVVKGWEACRHLQQWASWSQLCRLSQVSPSDSCLTLSSLCLVEHLPIFRSGQLSLQNSNHFFVLAILSQALHIVMSSFSLSMLGFWSVRNEIEDKHSKTTMNLRDLNQTQEAGKVFLFGLVFFFAEIRQHPDGFHMYLLSPSRALWESSWHINMYPAQLLQQPYPDVVCPQQLKGCLFGHGFCHRAPTNPGLH